MTSKEEAKKLIKERAQFLDGGNLVMIMSPDKKETWYTVRAPEATVADLVKMINTEPPEKPFHVKNNNIFMIRAGKFKPFIPAIPEPSVRSDTKRKIWMAAMAGAKLEDYGVAETPKTKLIYERVRSQVEEMRSQGVIVELPFDTTDLLP